MKCPECKKTMKWQEGLLRDGHRNMTSGKYYCPDCNLYGKTKESKAVREGRKLAKELSKYPAMHKEITKYPVAVQIGILRERQKNLWKKSGK